MRKQFIRGIVALLITTLVSASAMPALSVSAAPVESAECESEEDTTTSDEDASTEEVDASEEEGISEQESEAEEEKDSEEPESEETTEEELVSEEASESENISDNNLNDNLDATEIEKVYVRKDIDSIEKENDRTFITFSFQLDTFYTPEKLKIYDKNPQDNIDVDALDESIVSLDPSTGMYVGKVYETLNKDNLLNYYIVYEADGVKNTLQMLIIIPCYKMEVGVLGEGEVKYKEYAGEDSLQFDEQEINSNILVRCGSKLEFLLYPADGYKIWNCWEDSEENAIKLTEKKYIYESVTSAGKINFRFASMTAPVFNEINPDGYWISEQTGYNTVNVNISCDANNESNNDITKVIWSSKSSLSDADVLASDGCEIIKEGKFYKIMPLQLKAGKYYLYAVDKYDNISDATQIKLFVDLEAPKIEGSLAEYTKNEVYYDDFGNPNNSEKEKLLISYSISDNKEGIGVASAKYIITDSNDYKEINLDFDKTSIEIDRPEQQYSVFIEATDKLGNKSKKQLFLYDVEITINNEVNCFQTDDGQTLYYSSKIKEEDKTVLFTVSVLSSNKDEEDDSENVNSQESSNNSITGQNSELDFRLEVICEGMETQRYDKTGATVIWKIENTYLKKCKNDVEIRIVENNTDNTAVIVNIKWDDDAPVLETFEFNNQIYYACEEVELEPGKKAESFVRNDSNKMIEQQDNLAKIEIENQKSKDGIKVERGKYQVFAASAGDIILNFAENDKDVSYVGYTIRSTPYADAEEGKIPLGGSEKSGEEVEPIIEYIECSKNEDGKFYIPVEENKKGFLFIKVKDVVGNEVGVYLVGVISEDASEHSKNASVIFSGLKSNKRDAEKIYLHKNLNSFTIVATDTRAGIKKILWQIKGTEMKGTVDIDEEGALHTQSQNWSIGENSLEYNIVTKLTGKIDISKIEENGMEIEVTLIDNIGHTTTSKEKISIDRTAPIINLSYKGGEADETYTNIYKDTRYAIIEIKERNFNASDVEIEISKISGKEPILSEWKKRVDKNNPKNTVYSATLTFADDGEYDIKVNFVDMAGHAAKEAEGESFVIDKTLPEINISYNNNDVQNNSYYANSRTALITIKEKNFDAGRINIQELDINGGVKSQSFVVGKWNTIGDTHRLVIEFNADGIYRFGIMGRDKAGNEMVPYNSETFTVDRTMPEILVTGVEDKSANNKLVIPVIEFRDKNYDSNGSIIELSGANNGVVEVKGEYRKTEQGEIFTFDGFDDSKDADDLYTLKVSHTDMAGNTVQKIVRFSLNRYGSVYVFNGGLNEISGNYVNEASGIEVEEINIDRLVYKTIQIVIAVNGETRTLTEGIDYQVIPNEKDGSWSRYTYRFEDNLFVQDGTYRLMIYSVDSAGNKNSNTMLEKKAEIQFGIDNTAPVIASLNLENGIVYNESTKEALFSIADNFVLDAVKVMINGEEVDVEKIGDNYRFLIPQMDRKQIIQIVAKDIAGNESVLEMSEILISTNLFVRWINNTPLFVGTICILAVLLGGSAGIPIFLMKRRKRF
ncbi:MAG: hypothetical protein IJ291_02345 [Lachnospiraceae bacterium]|nr:hypothetical protein [Lachnospiraceae bacterium]